MHLFLKVIKNPSLVSLWLVVMNLTVTLIPLCIGARTPDTQLSSFITQLSDPGTLIICLQKSKKNALESLKIVVKTRVFGRGVNPSVKVDSKEVTDKKSGGQCKLSSPPVVQPQLHSHSPEHEYANSVQCNVTHKAVKGQGRGLNTTNWQHTLVSPVTGLGLNPVKVHQSVDSDLTEVKFINNYRCDTVPRDEHINGRGGMSSHSHSNVCKNILVCPWV